MAEPTLSHGNKLVLSIVISISLAVCMAAGSYRLMKTAQIKRWSKAVAEYSSKLEADNNAQISGYRVVEQK